MIAKIYADGLAQVIQNLSSVPDEQVLISDSEERIGMSKCFNIKEEMERINWKMKTNQIN